MAHEFVLANVDTDSISFSKKTGEQFSEEEQHTLLNELNSQFPEKIKFGHDGMFKTVVVLKIKNYITYDGEKTTIKGSALRSSKTEPVLKTFMNAIINCLLHDRVPHILNIYNEYVRNVFHLSSMDNWGSKKTITTAVLFGTRTNEKKILAALNGRSVQMGDKIYVYFTKDKSLKLVDNWNGDHDETVLLKKLYNTLVIFKNVININEYPKYTLKKNKAMLQVLLDENV